MTTIYVKESFVNKTTNTMFSETPVYLSRYETPGEVYRFCLNEYGRCTGKVHTETKTGDPHTGWAFEKLDKYSDSNETYLREVWVSLYQDEEGTPLVLDA